MTHSLSGIPGLASIPFFNYLFSEEQKEVNDNEIVFMLIPHIVRAQDLTPSNTKAIDVGTATNISLRAAEPQPNNTRSSLVRRRVRWATVHRRPSPAARQSSSLLPALRRPRRLQRQPGSAIVSFDPATLDQAMGSTFTVNVNLAGGQNVYSVPLQIMYNPSVLQLLNVSNGPMLSQDGQAVALVHRDDSMAGILQLTASRPPGQPASQGTAQCLP